MNNLQNKLTKSQLLFTAKLLELAADEFANHGCNDLSKDLEACLTQKEWDALNKEYHRWNGDLEEYRSGTILSYDWLWMGYMAYKLRQMAGEVRHERRGQDG